MGVIGFDVDNDILNGEDAVFEFVGNGVGDAVAFADGEVSIDKQLNVHPEAEPAFTDAAFMDPEHLLLVKGDGADMFENVIRGGGVHDFLKGFFEDTDGVVADKGAGEQRGPGIRTGKKRTAVPGEGDSDDGGD